MTAHPYLATTAVTVLTVGVTVAVAQQRIHHWKRWGMQTYENFADVYDRLTERLVDRLDVDLDLERLTSP